MAKVLYNEGRVVGYSAYEVYVKHSLSVDPDTPPASELEWLSSSIGLGTSMLVKIETDDISGPHVRDINFPSNTRLCAANTIIGSFFYGTGDTSKNSPWVNKVTDYGPLISNQSGASPSGNVSPTGSVPYKTSEISKWLTSKQPQIKSYMNVCDGLIIQPGKWVANSSSLPSKDFQPDLKSYPRLRLFLTDKITTSFFLLLTGFTLRTVIQGVSGTDTSVNTSNPEDGDFLGPAAYPWANKIVFSVPPIFANRFIKTSYKRKINGIDTESKFVTESPVIDMTSTDPGDYYKQKDSNSQLSVDVTELSTFSDDGGILTVCQRSDLLPPVLYGSKISKTGVNKLSPLDTAAPGSLKLYSGDGGDKVKELEASYPGAHGFCRDDTSYVVSQIDQSGQTVPVSDTYTAPIYGVLSSSQPMIGYFCQQRNVGDPDNYLGFGTAYSRRISGMLSDKFRQDCGIEYNSTLFNTIINLVLPLGQTTTRINTSMCTEMISDPSIGKQYYYILQSNKPTSSDDNYLAGYTLIPIKISNHKLDYVEKMYDVTGISLPWIKPPFSTSEDLSKQNYLGTWYDVQSISGHATVSSYLLQKYPGISHIQDPNRSLPLGSDESTWEEVYKNTKLCDVFSDSDLDGFTTKISDTQSYTYTKIHPDYRSLSLYDLLQTNLVHDVTNKNVRTFTEDGSQYLGIKLTKYIAKLDSLTVDSTDGISISDTVDFSSSINAGNFNNTVRIPIPSEYQNPDGPQAVIQISGNHQTAALSVADANNNMYDLSGQSGTISNVRDNTLHWDDLVEALAENKSIDLISSQLRDLIEDVKNKEGVGPDGDLRDYAIRLSKNSDGSVSASLTYAPNFNRLNCNFIQNSDGSQHYAIRMTENGNIYIANDRTAEDVANKAIGSTKISLKNDGSIHCAKNYIELNGLRLYLSTTEPKDGDIPKGSIGFGW